MRNMLGTKFTFPLLTKCAEHTTHELFAAGYILLMARFLAVRWAWARSLGLGPFGLVMVFCDCESAFYLMISASKNGTMIVPILHTMVYDTSTLKFTLTITDNTLYSAIN